MPPGLSDLIRTVRGYVAGPSQEEGRDRVSDAASADDDQSPPNTSRSVNTGTLQSTSRTTHGKRETYDGMAERDDHPVKRVRPTGDHEKRLTENYDIALDARRISIPGHGEEASLRVPARMPQGANRHGIRPMDTLRGAAVGGSAGRHVLPSLEQPRRYVRPRGAATPTSPARIREQVGKRRRTESLPPSSPSQPIDLTAEDHESQSRAAAARVEYDTRPASKTGQCNQRSNTSGSPLLRKPYFAIDSYHNTNSWTEVERPKSRKGKPSEFNPDTQLFSVDRTPPMQHHRRNWSTESSHETSRFFTAGVEPRTDAQDMSERRTPSSTGRGVPAINLRKGIPENQVKVTRHGKKHPESPTNPRDVHHSRHRPSAQRPSPNVAEEGLRQDKQAVRSFYANASESPNFATKAVFTRIPEQLPRPKAKDRMRGLPETLRDKEDRSRASIGSEDELSGATTIRSSALANAAKTATGAIDSRSNPKESASPNARLPRHTQVMDHVRVPQPGRASAKRSTGDEPLRHDLDAIRNPVASLYSRYCVLEDDNIELVWDHEVEGFRVEYNGELQMLPGGEQPFQIDKTAAAHALIQCEATRQMYLKGSISTFGNGHTLIEFKAIEGMSSCVSCLMHVLDGKVKPQDEDPRRMLQIFETQSLGLRELFDKEKVKVKVKKGSEHGKIGGPSPIYRPNRRPSHQVSDEEQIKYDDHSLRVSHSPLFDHPTPNISYSKSMKSHTTTEGSNNPSGPVDDQRRSARRLQRVPHQKPRTPTPEKWTRIHTPAPWHHPVTYPSSGARRVTVDFQDLERLDEGECLNDNIVDFALRQIEEGMEPQHRRDVHFFNSFFFSALSTKNGRKDFNYDAVKRWTRSTDLFTIPYVVVPINAEFHWFIAIICNLPALERRVSGLESEPGPEEATHPADTSSDAPHHGVDGTMSPNDAHNAKRSSPDIQSDPILLPSSSRSNMQVDDSDPVIDMGAAVTPGPNPKLAFQTHSKAPGKVRKKPIGRRYSPHDPVIMTLDSLGSTRGPEIRYLKQYIKAEARDKRAMEVELTQLLGITAKGVPEQSNFTDCGLYLIGYLEEFAKDPRKFVGKILRREMEETEFESFSPSAKRSEIRNALIGLHELQATERKAQKQKKRAAKRQAQPQADTSTQHEPTSPEPPLEHVAGGQDLSPNESDASPTILNSIGEMTAEGDAHAPSQAKPTQPDKLAILSEAHETDGLGKDGSGASVVPNGSHKAGRSPSPSIGTLSLAPSQPSNNKTTPKIEADVELLTSKHIAKPSARESPAETLPSEGTLIRAVGENQAVETLHALGRAGRTSRDDDTLSLVEGEGAEHIEVEDDQPEQVPEISDSQGTHGASQVVAVSYEDLEF